jgi:molybdopterin converting factor small subunit
VSIKIQIPFIFQSYTNKVEVVEVTGTTVGECFGDLVRQCPEIKKAIYNKDGRLASIVPIYKNDDLFHQLGELAPVKDGDIMSIVFMGGG